MTPSQQAFAAVCTTRYCLGRVTSAPQECADLLLAIWLELAPAARTAIQRDVERAFVIDDEQRARGISQFLELGMDCDRADWQRVRGLWTSANKG